MKSENPGISIELLGKSYPIKCSEAQVDSLRKAANFLEEKMRQVRDNSKVISIDRIAVIAALNIAHEFLNVENHFNEKKALLEQRIHEMQMKIENALECV